MRCVNIIGKTRKYDTAINMILVKNGDYQRIIEEKLRWKWCPSKINENIEIGKNKERNYHQRTDGKKSNNYRRNTK